MKDENWEQFHSFFHAFKTQLTENIKNIDELKIDFSETKYDIETNGTMTTYAEIFPFSKDFIIEFQGRKFLIDDQYCLSSTCNCKKSALTFVEIEEGRAIGEPSSHYAIFYNYLKRQWVGDVYNNGKTPGNKELIDAMEKEIPAIGSTLKNRHRNLRRLYANFNEDQEKVLQKRVNIKNKVGRNEPCPCGSGKKYKKCCGI